MKMSRREMLLGSVPAMRAAAEPVVRREVFLRSPVEGTAVMAYAFYTRPRGGAMMSIEQRWSRSDTIDVAYYRTSLDYGRTWSAPVERATAEKRAEGTLRRHLMGGWVEPRSGKFIEFWLEGVRRNDNDPLDTLRQWRIFYSYDGKARQLIHKGSGYDDVHWLPGVWAGRNCAMMGDLASRPLAMPDGSFLLPVEISPVDAEGKLLNPGGGYTWHETAVLRARWNRGELEWEMSDALRGDPARTTRGVCEPTIARLEGGRLVMVMRGSNDRKPDIPSLRWVSYSSDSGSTWTVPEPWTYSDGSTLLSPSSCSQLLEHSSGRLFWLGNISASNPRGNRPRYPFWIGEVDRRSGLLMRDSRRVVDDLAPGEDPVLSLSNFTAREDRRTHEICIHMTRLFALEKAWRGDAMLYRIRISGRSM